MVSPKTLLLIAIAATAVWAWRNGITPADIAAAFGRSGNGNDATASTRSARAGADATDPAAPAPAEEPVHTWVEANGVRHFSPASEAPAGSTPHVMGKTTVIHTEIATSPEAATAAVASPAESPRAATAGDPASAQAYELMDNFKAKLESIRQENNR